jgi:hypothetical protein
LPPAFTGPPIALDIEWLVSGEDMGNLLRRIRDLDDRAVHYRPKVAIRVLLKTKKAGGSLRRPLGDLSI